jgi:hypothetical protein
MVLGPGTGLTVFNWNLYSVQLYLNVKPLMKADEAYVDINITKPWVEFYTEYKGSYRNFTMAPPTN